MIEFEKYYNDEGEVAVLYSPGYGAGWYSWERKEGMLFDKDIVQAVLDNKLDVAAKIAEEKYNAYSDGARNLTIRWMSPGTQFEISEYDGYETINYSDDQIWMTA